MPQPDVRPFRAVRYDEAVAGDLGLLLAPPYDVSSPELIARLHERSPLNMTHLEHVRPDPGANPHGIVARRYRKWLAEGILRGDESPAFYRYDQSFALHGRRWTRRGLFGSVQMAEWSERVVLPHERTFPGPVAERYGRLRAVRANLSPVYFLAGDADGTFSRLLSDCDATPVASAVDPDGESHEIARVVDPEAMQALAEALANTRLYVADGHHRYEAALKLRDERRAGGDEGDAERVLALIAPASDLAVIILPTHRLVRGLINLDPASIRQELERWFELAPLAEPLLDEAIAVLAFAGERGWWRLTLRPARPHAQVLPADRSEAWRNLPAGIVETVLLQDVLGIRPEEMHEHLSFTHDETAVEKAVATGSAQIAILLPAPTVTELIAIANAGDCMPAKSTYFQPKVPAGLAIYDFALS